MSDLSEVGSSTTVANAGRAEDSREYGLLIARVEELRNDNARLLAKIEELCFSIRSRESEADFQRRFRNLVAEWKTERGHSSKLIELAMYPAYQQIIGMGQRAVPLLLDEMSARPDHWDWALRAITGVDPVPKESWGKLPDIAAAWIAWGREKGYAK